MTEELPPKRSRWPVIIVVASVLGLIVTCGVGIQMSSTTDTGGNPSAPTSVDSMEVLVDIVDFRYAPGNVSVPRGAVLTWLNEDRAPHTATELESAWDTGVLSEGESKDITFTRPGTYEYYCTIHPYMKGTIVVR